VSVVQPYATTVGGLTEACKLVDLVKHLGVSVIPGNWSSQCLGTAHVHLAAWSRGTPYIEYAPAEAYASPLRKALQSLGLPVANGAIALPTKPGIGYDLPDEVARQYAFVD
jgi:L-alanine-DL-glutamate epimerase-like enolase superfamily enzyme